MKTAWKWTGLWVVALWGLGCEPMGWGPMQPGQSQAIPQVAAQAKPAPAPEVGRADYLGASAVRGDEQTVGQGAVDVALEWSKKYAQATEQLMEAQKAEKELREENKRLLAQVAKLQIQADQSQKEVQEANEMLVELGKELREWKNNVMGYRNDMLQAQQVQMDALRKIMVLLGGEAAPAAAPATPAGPATPAAKAGEGPVAPAKETAREVTKATKN
jgi:hypothetical protein